MSRKNGGDLM